MIYDPLLGQAQRTADYVDATVVVVQEERPQVIVDERGVTVVSVGVQGPPGPDYDVVAPLQIIDKVISIVPGTVNGQGLIWNGSAWVNQTVVPTGMAGTIPYKSGGGYAGDDANLRYDSAIQALRVTKIESAVVDGGNF